MTSHTPDASNPLALMAQPAVALLRSPLNPFAYLPSTWMLLAGIDRLFGSNDAGLPLMPAPVVAVAIEVAAPAPKAKRTRGEGVKTREKRKQQDVVATGTVELGAPAEGSELVAAQAALVAPEPAPAVLPTVAKEEFSAIDAALEVIEVNTAAMDSLPTGAVPMQDFVVHEVTVDAHSGEVEAPATPSLGEHPFVVRALSFEDSIQPRALAR